MPRKTLYKSSSNKMISGVCGGLGEYFNLDPSVLRIALVAFTVITLPVFGPFVFLAYLVCIFIIPRNPDQTLANVTDETSGTGDSNQASQANQADQTGQGFQVKTENNSMVWGILLILLAAVVLTYSYSSGPAHFSFLLPLVPIAVISVAVFVLINYRGQIMGFFRHRRLYRLREGKKIFGVCVGLADSFDLDPTLVRIGFFVAFLFSVGTVTLLYLFMAFVMPVGRPESPGNDT